jgi:hypothetical protein
VASTPHTGGYPPAAEVYPENGNPVGSNQNQWFDFAVSGSGFTICNVAEGACLTDGGGVVDIGQGDDEWSVTPFDLGYAVQDTRSGNYMGAIPSSSQANIPMSATPVEINLIPAS